MNPYVVFLIYMIAILGLVALMLALNRCSVRSRSTAP